MLRVRHSLTSFVAAGTFVGLSVGIASADPLSNEVPKFFQAPLYNTPVFGAIYDGHDELSTANLGVDPTTGATDYSGTFMADDFADKVSTPVVHLSFWGSYLNNSTIVPPPYTPVQKFLISFESDVPVGPGNAFSHPGQVLSSEIVTPGIISPGSGTFTETLLGGGSVDGNVYKYNAELKTPFPELANTVYWLKIVALVDKPAGDPTAPIWGWHDRDYTIQDPLASTPPLVNPGETNIGPAVSPIWHFQDDAVNGVFNALPNSTLTSLNNIRETNSAPQDYIDNIDGPAGIGQYSKDLAFELFTPAVPEPTSLGMLTIAGFALTGRRRNRLA